jgi:hypothetical protein
MSYVSGRLFTASVTGVTTSPVQLHPTQNCREVMIQADPDNVGNLLVGTVVNQFIRLTPGQAITLPVISLNLIYVKMSTGTGTVNWLARD